MIDTMHIWTILKLLFEIGIAYLVCWFIVRILLYYTKGHNIKWQKEWVNRLRIILRPFFIGLFIFLLFIKYPMWTALFCLISYFGFKDYIVGYFLGINYKLNQKLNVGSIIEALDIEGVVAEFASLGIWINSDTGIKFINYRQLHKKGYYVKNNNYISNNYTLLIQQKEGEEIRIQDLEDIIYGSPYLDSDQSASITKDKDIFTIKINLRSQQYLDAFVAFLDENNYSIIKPIPQ